MFSFADTTRLPIIDLSLFDAGDPWRDHVAAQVDWAASEFGFFYIVGHGIEQEVIDSLLRLSHTFFDQKAETKNRVHMSRGGRAWRGQDSRWPRARSIGFLPSRTSDPF